MCSEICQFSSFLRTMSSSDEPRLFPDEREDHEREGHETSEELIKESDKATVSDTESEKKIPPEEDDDGFKTPTSPDQRIPAITECPPPPKKPRPPPSRLKRKASPPPAACRSLQFEASTAEVESIFRPISNDQDDAQDREIKRARKDDDNDDKDPS